jgi:transglutaminase-like putative cysteine protease
VNDTGQPDVVVSEAYQHAVEDLPDEALMFLLASRYCETDRLSEIAWSLFGKTPLGWGRVQAICDFVHQHIAFGYEHARASRTAWEVFCDRTGVCRDYAQLAVAFCRCMNIPARYCTSYLGDIGVSWTRRWISRPGSKPTSVASGTPLMRATTSRASAEY